LAGGVDLQKKAVKDNAKKAKYSVRRQTVLYQTDSRALQ